MRPNRGRNKSYREWECVKQTSKPSSLVDRNVARLTYVWITLTCWGNRVPWSLLRCFWESPGPVSAMLIMCFSCIPSGSAFLLMFPVWKLTEGFPPHRHGERCPPRGFCFPAQHVKSTGHWSAKQQLSLVPILWDWHCVLCPFPISVLHFPSCSCSTIDCAWFAQWPPWLFSLHTLPLQWFQ